MPRSCPTIRIAAPARNIPAIVDSDLQGLFGRRDQNSRNTPHARGGATGACAHGDCAALPFILNKGFAPDRVDVESYERDHHRQEKTTQRVRSRLLAYQFAIHRYSLGWGRSDRRSEVEPTMQGVARRLRRATLQEFAASRFVTNVACAGGSAVPDARAPCDMSTTKAPACSPSETVPIGACR